MAVIRILRLLLACLSRKLTNSVDGSQNSRLGLTARPGSAPRDVEGFGEFAFATAFGAPSPGMCVATEGSTFHRYSMVPGSHTPFGRRTLSAPMSPHHAPGLRRYSRPAPFSRLTSGSQLTVRFQLELSRVIQFHRQLRARAISSTVARALRPTPMSVADA